MTTDERIVLYTNAPQAYDYDYVEVLDPEVGRYTGTAGTHPVIRKLLLHTDEWHRDYQTGRYGSGMYSSFTQEEFDKWVEEGLIELTEATGWTVIARTPDLQTRYARTFETEDEARLHVDCIRAAWLDPLIEITVEKGGPIRNQLEVEK